jgi:hypothetical protein
MKLVISFREVLNFKLPDSEFILVSKFNSHSLIDNVTHFLIEDIYINDSGFLRDEEKKYAQYINELPGDLADVFTASKTTLYFVMMAFENWRATIERILQANYIDEIIFSDLVFQHFYLPFYEAESEVTKPLYYEPFDFISTGLFDYLSEKHKTISISIKKEHSKFSLFKRVFIRRYGLLSVKIFLQTIQLIKRFSFRKRLMPLSKRFLLLSRGVAHSQYVLDFAKYYSDDVCIYASDGLRTLGKNNSFLNKGGLAQGDYVDSMEISSLLTLYKSAFHIFKLLLKYNLKYKGKLKMLDKQYKLAYSSSVNEMIIHYLETHIYVSNLKRFLVNSANKGKPTELLVSCEIYTQYSYFIALLGRNSNIKTIQLISVAMNIVPLPRYFFCGKAVFNQKQVYRQFEEHNPSLKDIATYWGNLTFDENAVSAAKKSGTGKLSIVYFSQPVADEENDFVIIDKLLQLQARIPLEIMIKQHPREEPDKFSRYGKHVTVYSGTVSLKDAIHGADIAIVKFSAVEHYLLNYGIPTIYCSFSEIARLSMTNIISTGYKGIAFSPLDLENILLNAEGLGKIYYEFRNQELFNRFENKGINVFRENLVKYADE